MREGAEISEMAHPAQPNCADSGLLKVELGGP